MLTEIDRSPVIALNRAVVISNVQGPEAGLAAIAAIGSHDALNGYYLYHAVLAHLRSVLGDSKKAAIGFRRAAELTSVTSEQAFLRGAWGNAERELQKVCGDGCPFSAGNEATPALSNSEDCGRRTCFLAPELVRAIVEKRSETGGEGHVRLPDCGYILSHAPSDAWDDFDSSWSARIS